MRASISGICRGMIVVWILSAALPDQGRGQEVFTTGDGIRFTVETVLTGLEIPWSMVFAGDGTMYFTERPGRLSMLVKGSRNAVLLGEIQEVRVQGEGGLMGLALHPDFDRNKLLYVSYTFTMKGSPANRVTRYRLEGTKLVDREVIVPYLPGAFVHNGCRIRFGPDKKLYVTTGDAAQRDLAQDIQSLAGKILRVNEDGSIPADNPDPDSPVYALGVRNPQGIDWHPEAGLLFETEHGPSGFDGPGGGDEVNIIEPGRNYGWPVISHTKTKEGYVAPLLEYSPAIAPASGVFYRGSVFPGLRNNFLFGCLRGNTIQRVVLDKENPRKVLREESLLEGKFRRIRDVAVCPDGYVYFSTSNRDGRARPFEVDDRIIRIVPVE